MADHRVNIFLTVKQKGMKVLKGAVAGLQKSISGLFRLAKQATFALAGAFGVGAFFVKAAADAEEAESKFDAVFKDLAAQARAWSEDTAMAVNRSAIEIREFMSVLQDTFVPFGFARDKAAELSKEVVKLGIDLASFNNKAEADVIRDLQSALVGNTETVRKYGIALSETAIKLEAVRSGMSRTGKNLTELQKMQVRLNLIQRGSADAMGDAQKTAGSFTNRIKGLVAAFKDFRIEVGAQIIKGAGLSEVVDTLTKRVRKLFDNIRSSKSVQSWADNARTALEAVAKGFEAVFGEDDKKRELALDVFKESGARFLKIVGNGLLIVAKLFGRLAAQGFKSSFQIGTEVQKQRMEATRLASQELQALSPEEKERVRQMSFGERFKMRKDIASQKFEELRRQDLLESGISAGDMKGIFEQMVTKLDNIDQSVNGLKQPR